MKIADYKKLLVERSNEFINNDSIGIILKTAEELKENRYGVFIGRLMSGTYPKDPYEEKVKLDSNKCLNSINKKIGDDEVTSSNFIVLSMFSVYNLSMPRLIKGERVSIGMIDQDIKSIYIRPFYRDQIKYRPTDTLEMYVPASGNYDGADMDDTNKYYLRLDSVSKTIRLHMSDGNDEVAQYDLIFDGTNGNISLSDGKRNITMNTKNDEIFLVNEENSMITLRKDTIDITTGKFYLKAKDSITIESPKMEETIKDSISITTDKYTGKLKDYSIEGKKMAEKYETVKIDNTKKRELTCPKTIVKGLVSVSDWINANGGISFGGPKDSAPMPTVPQIDKKGNMVLSGPSSIMLVKLNPLLTLLTQIGIKLDLVGTNPKWPVTAPMIAPLIASNASQLGAVKAKA